MHTLFLSRALGMLAVFALDTCVDLLAVPALVSAGLAPARPTLHVSLELIYVVHARRLVLYSSDTDHR